MTTALAVMETEATREMRSDPQTEQPTLPTDPSYTNWGTAMNLPVQQVTWCEACCS